MRRLKERFYKTAIYISAGITCAVLFWIVGYVALHGAGEINADFLFGNPQNSQDMGLMPMVVTTLYMIFLSLIVSTPLGVGAAVFLVEYAKGGRVVRIIRFAVESLAGIPSIIYGLFGFLFFVNYLQMGWTIPSGAMTLSIMVLPVIIRSTEESLKAVPISYREASLALGATKLRTIIRIIVPSAARGVMTAIILSIGRIVGETAAIYMTAGTDLRMPDNLFASGRTLAIHLYLLAQEAISLEKAFATATVLIAVIVVINIAANQLSKQINKKVNA